jgi:hypothetical protein
MWNAFKNRKAPAVSPEFYRLYISVLTSNVPDFLERRNKVEIPIKIKRL